MLNVPKAKPEMFPGVVGDIVRTFEASTEAAAEPIAAQFLVAFGNAVGRGPAFKVGATRHGLNENLLAVGRTSKARKGDSNRIALCVLERADLIWATWCTASGLSSGEGLVHRVRDRVERCTKKGETEVVDEGVTDKRLLVTETEFSGALKVMTRDGNTLSPVLRDAWDGKPVLGTLTKASPTRATNAHISIIGHATPEDLHVHLAEVDAVNGLANRFVFLLTDRVRLCPMPAEVDASTFDGLVRRVLHALEAAKQVTELRLTRAAEALWRGIYRSLSGEIPGLVGAVLGRAEPHVLRFGGIYALLAGAQEIDVEHLLSALALWDVVDASAREIFRDRTGNALVDRLPDSMLPGETLNRDEVHDRLGRHTGAARLQAALRLLVGLGEFRVVPEGTGGRPRQVVLRRPAAGWPEGQQEAQTS
jgi:hypothetical protein